MISGIQQPCTPNEYRWWTRLYRPRRNGLWRLIFQMIHPWRNPRDQALSGGPMVLLAARLLFVFSSASPPPPRSPVVAFFGVSYPPLTFTIWWIIIDHHLLHSSCHSYEGLLYLHEVATSSQSFPTMFPHFSHIKTIVSIYLWTFKCGQIYPDGTLTKKWGYHPTYHPTYHPLS